jgi:WD40 repeat protein
LGVAGEREEDVALEATVSADTVASQAAPLTGSGVHELPEVAPDRYVAGSEVGRGGIGRVVRARDQVLERPVAIKELFATDEASRRRFVRETLITARLQHPSIIPVYDAGRRDHSPFYAMKLVAGTPLDRALTDARTFAQRLALLPNVLAVADAIAYAHDERIIHRDLKPGNVLVGKFGETIVIDWGLAKDLSIDDRDALPAGPYRDDSAEHTVAGSVLGTPGYMAPEQAEGADVDERTDVYALGAILYHVISGALPHQGTTLEDVIAKVIRGDIRPLLDVEPQTPPDLAAIVGKAMANDRAARYRTAKELAQDLRRFQTGQLVGAHHYTAGQRLRRWIARNRGIAMVSAIATLVLLVFGTWSIRRIIAKSDEATEQRDVARENEKRALGSANAAIINQARALRDRDPALALAWLSKLEVGGTGWDGARILVADLLSRPRLLATMHGPAGVLGKSINASPFEITRDGRSAVGLDATGLWILDLQHAKTKPIRHANDPQESRSLELCDDGRRAYALTGGFGNDLMFEIDLHTAAVKSRRVRKAEWARIVEGCNAQRALRASAEGLTWRDPTTGTQVTLSTAPTDAAWLAPDRAHVVALGRDGGVRRFDLTGKELGSIPGAAPLTSTSFDPLTGWQAIAEAALSNDGSVVVTVVRGSARFWSFTHGRQVALKNPDVRGVAVKPDGSVAYVTWKAHAERVENRSEPLAEVADEIPGGRLEMSPDGKWLAALADDGGVSLVDLVAHTPHPLRGHDSIEKVAFLPDGQLVTSGDDIVRLWNLPATARSHGHVAVGAAVSPDGRWIAIDSGTSIIRRDLAGKIREETPHPRQSLPVDLAISNAGEVAFGIQKLVYLWPRGSQQATYIVDHKDGSPAAVAILPDGAVVSVDHHQVIVWRPTGSRVIRIPRGAARISPNSRFEVDAAGTRALVTCNPEDETPRTCFVDLIAGRAEVLPGSTDRAAISPDGRIAITGVDGAYAVWDLDRRAITLQRDDVAAVQAIGISRDGTRAVVGGVHGIDVVDIPAKTRRSLDSAARARRGRMMFSPDGRAVIDESLAWWDVASGEHRQIASDRSRAAYLGDDALIAIDTYTILIVPDDLPREPAALSRLLVDLQYEVGPYGALKINK